MPRHYLTNLDCTTLDRSYLTNFLTNERYRRPLLHPRYNTLREWALARFDRHIHYFDQMLHQQSLKQYEDKFNMEMKTWLRLLTPETVLERLKSKRNALANASQLPFNSSHPFVLQHGDFHGRNVLVRYGGHSYCLLLCPAVTHLPQPNRSSSHTRSHRLGLRWIPSITVGRQRFRGHL